MDLADCSVVIFASVTNQLSTCMTMVVKVGTSVWQTIIKFLMVDAYSGYTKFNFRLLICCLCGIPYRTILKTLYMHDALILKLCVHYLGILCIIMTINEATSDMFLTIMVKVPHLYLIVNMAMLIYNLFTRHKSHCTII